MSFDEEDKRSKKNNSDEDEFYDLDNGNEKSNGSMDDFLKDEDFEFEGYKEESKEEEGSREVEGVRSRRTRQRKKRRKGIFIIIAAVLALVIVAAGIVFWVVPWAKNKFFSKEVVTDDEDRIDVPESLALGKNINIVFTCAGENLLEPDVSTIIFSSYYSSENKLISLCIPPKTLMDIPTIGVELIGRSVNEGGMDLLDLSLENNLGMDMEVDYHILFDVYNTVNKLGGIVLELEDSVTVKNYDDGSNFNLEKGENLIDGAEALSFLKYFSGLEEDVPVENITNQKLVIDAIIKKAVGESDEDLSTNLNLIKDYMDTNLSMEESLKIFSTFSSIEQASNQVYSLEVSSTPDPEGESIFYIPQDISELSEIFSKEGVGKPTEETGDFNETVKITVLNGAYDSPEAFGLATDTSEIFRNLKFDDGRNKYDVTDIGNSDNIYDNTQILVYSPDANKLAAADEIIQVLGTGSINMRENEAINSDIIIILGKDYLALATGSTEEDGAETMIVKIIVINGEGTGKLAATVTDILNNYFNADEERAVMLEPRSADNFNYTETEITIFNSGDVVDEVAQSIQERLGVGTIEYSDNNVDNVDISVTLGSDYTSQ